MILDYVNSSLIGIVHLIFGQPLDLLKTKCQLSSVHSLKNSISIQGIRGLYKGSSLLLIGLPLTTALQFSLYEQLKFRMMKKIHKSEYYQVPQQLLSLPQIGLIGSFTGITTSVLLTPLQYCKLQKQSQVNLSKKGSLGIFLQQMKLKRFNNLYKGYWLCFARQTIGCSFYFATYEGIVRKICQLKNKKRRFAQFWDFVTGGSVAGLAYSLVGYQFDFYKTNVQIGRQKPKMSSQIQSSFFRGLLTSCIRGSIINGISFGLYEQIKATLQIFMMISVS